MSYADYQLDQDNILTITMNDPDKPVNVMNAAFEEALAGMVERVESERESLKGIILTSAKKTFFAGGDLEEILYTNSENAGKYYKKVMRIKSHLRQLETVGIPFVTAINGSALGGGFEICLASHYRVAQNDVPLVVGLPEVTLGLLPGGGGVVRLVRLLGLQKAWPLLSEGTSLRARDALAAGLVDDLADSREDLLEKARAWILSDPLPKQPWDQEGYSIPGGVPGEKLIDSFVVATTARLQSKDKGLYPAPQAILAAAVESMQVDFESANRIESRYLTSLAQGCVAKNMITTFFQLNELRGGASRPQGYPVRHVKKLGILGAGMMGSGIAYSAASIGLPVVLKDVTLEAANNGRKYTQQVTQKQIDRGTLTISDGDTILKRIQATDRLDDLADCDLVIEAVFEDRSLKASVTHETEAQLQPDALFASNTSTLPITGLAQASRSPENFIGLHFFSPVDRMPLVEIICGERTSDETLARAYDFVRQLGKLPIVVNDSRDFFTSRVYESYCDEGAWLLSDGIAPALIENLARQTGMPAGPLASVDAVSQKLVYSIKSMAKRDAEEDGRAYSASLEPPFQWVERMVNEFGRTGKIHGAGYYEYPKGGRKFLWPELALIQPKAKQAISHQDIKDRILFRQSIEAVRCLEEGVLRNVVDGNIGSMKGIGFPPYTGGQLQYINAYGIAAFTKRASDLAKRFGDRFAPPQLLLDMAESGARFQ